MKLFKGKSKFKIFIIIIVIYTIVNLVEISIYKSLANSKINTYIQAQGLGDEEVLRDSGIIGYHPLSYIGRSYNRKIIYKNNPNQIYGYSVHGRRFEYFPFLTIPFLNTLRLFNESAYEEVQLEVEEMYDYDYRNLAWKFSIYEGELDKNGKLISIMPWVDINNNKIYDEDSKEVKEFINDLNTYINDPDNYVSLKINFKNARELYDSLVEDGFLDEDITYEKYLQYIVEERKMQKID